MLDPVTVDGITLASKFRVYPRAADNRPLPEPLIVGVDLTDYRFELSGSPV